MRGAKNSVNQPQIFHSKHFFYIIYSSINLPGIIDDLVLDLIY